MASRSAGGGRSELRNSADWRTTATVGKLRPKLGKAKHERVLTRVHSGARQTQLDNALGASIRVGLLHTNHASWYLMWIGRVRHWLLVVGTLEILVACGTPPEASSTSQAASPTAAQTAAVPV